MPSSDFPSGPWTGFYQYKDGKRGSMDLTLRFSNGRMDGAGNDELGQFLIAGTYNEDSKEARWIKSYPAKHSIDYRGFREGPLPGIWGTWQIGPEWSGGFHIWPLGQPTSEDERAKATRAKRTKRVGKAPLQPTKASAPPIE